MAIPQAHIFRWAGVQTLRTGESRETEKRYYSNPKHYMRIYETGYRPEYFFLLSLCLYGELKVSVLHSFAQPTRRTERPIIACEHAFEIALNVQWWPDQELRTVRSRTIIGSSSLRVRCIAPSRNLMRRRRQRDARAIAMGANKQEQPSNHRIASAHHQKAVGCVVVRKRTRSR